MTLPPLKGGSTRRSVSGFPQRLTHYGKLSCTFTSRSALTLKSVPHPSPPLRGGSSTDESPFPDVRLPNNGINNEERPTSGLPDPTVLHLQVFSTSWRLIPFVPLRLCFTPLPFVAFAYRGFPPSVTRTALRQPVPAMPFAQLSARFDRSFHALPTDRDSADVRTRWIRYRDRAVTHKPRLDPLLTFYSPRCSPLRT